MCVHGIPKADTFGEDAVEADNIITELCKALEITMQAYHDTHPKYIMAEKALKKARIINDCILQINPNVEHF